MNRYYFLEQPPKLYTSLRNKVTLVSKTFDKDPYENRNSDQEQGPQIKQDNKADSQKKGLSKVLAGFSSIRKLPWESPSI